MLIFGDSGRIYNIGELAEAVDRSPLTIKRWEASGLIPKAKRDSRGWRYYTEGDIKEIIRIVKENDYFTKLPKS